MTDTKRCPRCKETLPVSSFGRNRYRPDGLADYCHVCKLEVQREQSRARHAKYNAARRSIPDEGQRYRAPEPKVGVFPCKVKYCEYDSFTCEETLEMHYLLRHGEPAA